MLDPDFFADLRHFGLWATTLAARLLARHVADAAFGEFRRQIEYKAAWRGGRMIVADRWFASSKTCSGCGAAKTKLALSERTYRCASCGLALDWDLNAACNLAALGQQILAGSGPESNGRGADHQTRSGEQVAPKRQPGTAMDQTGTVPTQDGTVAGVITITPVATERPLSTGASQSTDWQAALTEPPPGALSS